MGGKETKAKNRHTGPPAVSLFELRSGYICTSAEEGKSTTGRRKKKSQKASALSLSMIDDEW
jgi:hypothetical protein